MTSYRILYHHRIRAQDGQAVHVREMIHALRGLGHDVAECALVPKAGGGGVAESNGHADTKGSFWQKLRLPRAATECTEILYSRKGLSMILAAARRGKPDFIYERHALHCRAGLLAKRRLGVPLLLEVNSPMCDEMKTLGLLHFENLARRSEREVLGQADRVLAVSDVLAARLVELGAPEDRVRVIRNGAEPERSGAAAAASGRAMRERLGLTNGQFVLGFIGFMRPWHRLDMVVEALARLGRPELHFVMAGEGPALPELLAQARAQGVGDRVHALGALPGDEVAAVCTGFDVALVPAINEYASPLKMFDSLSAGVATLALDQPNIRELIVDGESGVLFEPGDLESLSARLAELASDRKRTRAIGAAGRAALIENDWTWRGSAQRVLQCYEELR